ncbi:TIGR01777 family oxidoreductase [Aestuariirhabdus litorea]|uniref:TIGR01777 family protein n=1 Tax=Aestuariirhabdus litorea TaxID=2528527 RepID=A0A3P3VUY7_9GAMM|nr:TIGR01777 family oxidoreductase [Aestuariirhabdus litorea]RRJ84563.1 TIGR01777 family protein [Aestuariirhabdus litorea]RWW97789.1 TIGR01777 family protein [Endozoicomonadaceae bacterium GTF-13]
MDRSLLVTGGTGFIGYQLLPTLVEAGYRLWVLTRREPASLNTLGGKICYISSFDQVAEVDGVINLAGEGIVDSRWSERRKQQLLESRENLTLRLVDWLGGLSRPPEAMISGSAVGYYGYHDPTELLDESQGGQQDFASTLCQRWEAAAIKAEALGVRVCRLRIGVVLAANGGALGRMLPPFKLGLGGPIATGKQMISWIQREDLIAAILFLLHSNDLSGAFNATSPHPVSNRVFSEALAKVLGRPCWLPVPAYAMRLLLGEASDLLVKGQAVVPERLLKAGFTFRHPLISDAIEYSLKG